MADRRDVITLPAESETRRKRPNAVKWLVYWLAAGFVFQIVAYGDTTLLSPATWAHVLAWPLFLLIVAVKWFLILAAVVAVLVVAFLLFRAAEDSMYTRWSRGQGKRHRKR